MPNDLHPHEPYHGSAWIAARTSLTANLDEYINTHQWMPHDIAAQVLIDHPEIVARWAKENSE